jgi:hypothetical protein
MCNTFMCNTFTIQIEAYQNGVYSIFRQCQASIYNIHTVCSNDEDCALGVPCDLVSHLCAPPPSILEEDYFGCIFSKLTTGLQSALKGILQLPFEATTAELYSALRQQTLTQDCLAASGPNTPYHSYYEYTYNSGDFAFCVYTYTYYGDGAEMCLDETCDGGPDSDGAYCTRFWVCRYIAQTLFF